MPDLFPALTVKAVKDALSLGRKRGIGNKVSIYLEQRRSWNGYSFSVTTTAPVLADADNFQEMAKAILVKDKNGRDHPSSSFKSVTACGEAFGMTTSALRPFRGTGKLLQGKWLVTDRPKTTPKVYV